MRALTHIKDKADSSSGQPSSSVTQCDFLHAGLTLTDLKSESGRQHDRTHDPGLSTPSNIEAKAHALIAWQRRSSPLDCPTVPLDVALLEMVMGAG